MCTSILYNGRMIGQLAEAVEVFGADNVVICEGYPVSLFLGDMKSCLCPVHMEMTAAAVGCRIGEQRDHDDSMLYRFENRPTT